MVSVKTKTGAIEEISELLGRVTARFTAEDPEEQEWMGDQCSPAAARALVQLSVSMLHLLDMIPGPEANESIKVVDLAQSSGTPKGTVSKSVRRMVEEGVVERHRLPNNRKEVHLRLTPIGAEIRAAHRSLHAQMGSGLDAFLNRYTSAELAVLAKVLNDLVRMPREGLRFRPDLLD